MKNMLQSMLLHRTAFFFFAFSAIFFTANAQVTPVGTPAFATQTNTIASFTVPAGSKRMLVVTASDGFWTTITGCTFNGTAMTKRKEVTDGFISCDAIFTLSLGDAATSTTGSIVFTNSNGIMTSKVISAAAFTKVDQTTPFSDMQGDLAGTGTSTLSVNSTVGDLVFDIFDTWNSAPTGSQVPGSGQTVATTTGPVDFSAAGGGYGFYSTGRKAGAAGTVTTTWNAAGHEAQIHITVNMKQDNVVLPLKLLAFTGNAKNNDALMNWSTTDETNVSHTEVERSTNGTDFSFVVSLDKSVKNYTDINALDNVNSKLFYRLKMVDNGGSFTYSNIIIVQAKNKSSLITAIQPLFASGRIAVSFNLPQAKNATLQLTDISGNTIRKSQLTASAGISTRYMDDLQSLPAGVYVLQIVCGDERLTQKLVK